MGIASRWLLLFAVGFMAAQLAFAFPAKPAPDPVWRSAGTLTEPRAYARTVMVDTGEILVDGGLGPESGHLPERAQLIDPLTGRVRLTEPSEGRLWHTVTPLRSGLVLVAGGVQWKGDYVPVARADLLNPWTGRWFAAAPMRHQRTDHSAVRLPDGRVLVAGGNAGPELHASVEIYDPLRDEWSEAAPMPMPRTQFVMALAGGRVLVAGGRAGRGMPSRSSALYDIEADRWTVGPQMSIERALHTAVSLPNGDVLVIGGDRAASNTAERYDVSEQIFMYAGTLAHPRMLASATLMNDGRVLLVGGADVPHLGRFASSARAEAWSPQTNRWAQLHSIDAPRILGGLVSTDAGAFFIGGASPEQAPTDAIDVLR